MNEAPDPEKLQEHAAKVLGYMSGAMAAMGIWVGDELGLYRSMDGAGPLTSDELAARTGLHERWVREWLAQQASAGLVTHHGDGKFELSREMGVILADESTPASMIGMFASFPDFFAIARGIPESFRTGLGRAYDAHGRVVAEGMRRSTATTTGMFADIAIPALDGVAAKLESGGTVADIGCGAGGRLIALAQRHPASRFFGYDISAIALDLAREGAAAAGVANLTFHNPDDEPLPDGTFDLVTFGDVVHDLAHPDRVFGGVRRALKPDGTVLVIDMAAGETIEENLANPMAPMMYGISMAVCLSSSLSEEGGVGIGTLGLSPSRLESIVRDAGFTRFRRTEVADMFNAYYEIRP